MTQDLSKYNYNFDTTVYASSMMKVKILEKIIMMNFHILYLNIFTSLVSKNETA